MDGSMEVKEKGFLKVDYKKGEGFYFTRQT